MFDYVIHFINRFRLEYWMYICLGIIALIFLLGALLSLASGNAVKFKSAAKRALKRPLPEGFDATLQYMPLKVRKLYNDAKKSGQKPSDIVTLDACVNAPFSASVAGHFATAVMAASLLCVSLMFVVGNIIGNAQSLNGYAATAIVIVIAMVFRLLSGLIGMAVHKSCVRTYGKYADALDKTLQGNDVARESCAEMPKNDRVAVPVPDKEKEIVSVTAKMNESEEVQRGKTREEAWRNPSDAESGTKMQTAQQAYGSAAQPMNNAVDLTAPMPYMKGSSADDVVARIERINREGATVSTMREVAFALQQERAKPENKTPEQQKKLNEALATLLKAMTAAQKK